MADITVFIRGLAGKKQAPRDVKPDALAKFGATTALEAVIAERQGGADGKDKDEAARKAYDKMFSASRPVIDAALGLGMEPAAHRGKLASKLTEAQSCGAWDDWKAAGDALAEAGTMAREILDARAVAFQTACDQAMSSIGNAVGLTEIGGGMVAANLLAAKALAATGKYVEAHARLEKTKSDADRVNERAPFVRARRRHGPTIKAAFGIAHDGLGQRFKAAWEQAEKTAASGAYDSAAAEVEALATAIDRAKNSAVLMEKRDAVQKARAGNIAAMQQALEAGTVDVAALRLLVVNEIGGKEAPLSFASQATAVGDDLAAKTREPIGDEVSAEKRFMESDWFALKEMLHAKQIEPEAMWDCWRYRQQYVTRLIDQIRKQFPTLIAKTSGSADLESDIDITFASGEPGDDVKAAMAFNKAVKGKFGKPPGRVFDVNIYPRDYNAIEESINTDYNLDPLADADIDQPEGAMHKLSSVDQDVATLVKQRRFLDAKAFADLMESVLDGAPDPATKKQIRKQFEEGEAIFLTTALEKVRLIEKKLTASGTPLPAELAQLNALSRKSGIEAAREAQQTLQQVLEKLESSHPADVMEATDEAYLAGMAELRENQTRIARLGDTAADPGEHHGQSSCEELHRGVSHEVWRAGEAQRLKAEVKKAQFTNIIFANEAYMSQGAIEHVVAGIQAKDAVTKQAVLAKLTLATLVQSCNEQLADFFKDMKAKEGEIALEQDVVKKRRGTGEAFVHASKYLVRLLDAAQLLADKFADFDPPVAIELSLLKTTKLDSPKALKQRVESLLLALRKSSTVPADAKGEVGFAEASSLFGVDKIDAFRELITRFGAELNQQVRRNPEFKAEVAVDQQIERQYFGVPPMPDDLKALLDDAAAALNASFGEGVVLASIGEAEGETDAAEELLSDAGDLTPLPNHLAGQFQDAAIRAQQALSTFAKIDPKAAIARGASFAEQLDAKIKALDDYDTEALHHAYIGDIDRSVERLRDKAAAVGRQVEDIREGLKVIIPLLSQQLAVLKKRSS